MLASSLGDPRCRVVNLRLAHNGIGRRGGEHLGLMLEGGGGVGQWGLVSVMYAQELALVTLYLLVLILHHCRKVEWRWLRVCAVCLARDFTTR